MEEDVVGKVNVGEELPKCILIEDLGMMYPTETSKEKARFGIYECGFCGTHFKTMTTRVKMGHTNSCGCYQKSQSTKHGGKGTKLYSTWANIKDRTANKNNKQYSDYGGRNIIMWEDWFNNFTTFREWSLNNRYTEDDKSLSIDRIDNDGNYEPSNCRWTTKNIQARNTRMQINNTSGFRGVSWNKRNSKFMSYLSVNYKRKHLGYFLTAVEGAIAYNNYIIENSLEGFILNIIPNENEEIKND